MNLAPDLPAILAVGMSLLAAFLWGTWFISLKYLGDYPVDGFLVTLFTTSVVFVWVVALALDGPALGRNLAEAWSEDPSRVWVTLLCGILYVIGMRLSMTVLATIGLSLTQPIQSSIYILVGTIVSAIIGGMPPGLTPGRVALAVGILLAAVACGMAAGVLRSQAQELGQSKSSLTFTRADLWRSLGTLVISSAFVPAYTFALSFGLKSVSQPSGLAVLPFMALLASGAFVGSLLSSGLALTRAGLWSRVFTASLSIHKYGILSGLAHYGGNIIHTFATASLSSVVAWPLGVTSGLWTQVWGLVYGEFRGFPRRVYAFLIAGLALYIIGAAIIAGY